MDMFVWTSGFQNPLAHTHFNMFVDTWTSTNESPAVSTHTIVNLMETVTDTETETETRRVNRPLVRMQGLFVRFARVRVLHLFHNQYTGYN